MIEEEIDDTCTCGMCGGEVPCDEGEYIGNTFYCIYCIKTSEANQDEFDNSSCYSPDIRGQDG